MLAFDAQTSGGLLICVPAAVEDKVLSELINSGLTGSSVIGKVIEYKKKFIHLNN
jgi:selenide,water dikinase